MRMVQLTMVVGVQHHQVESQTVDETEGEDDGLPVEAPAPAPAPVEVTTPVMVDADKVRCFYPRKKQRDGTERVGTRLTFENGSGMAVTELFNDVAAKFGRPN